MESKILNVWDYWKVDISQFKQDFNVDEEAIDVEIFNERNRKAQWSEGEAIQKSDIAECKLKSECKKYQKDNVTLVVGAGLFHKEIEDNIIGKKENERIIVQLADANLEVQVLTVKNKKLPDFTDEFVQALDRDGIRSVEDYRENLIRDQRMQFVQEIEYPAIQYVMKEVSEKSEILIKKYDWVQWIKQELDKIRILAKQEGCELEKMTKEDFEGKIPVSSFSELVSMMQDQAWGNVEDYLLGCYYAKNESLYNEATYEEYIIENAKDWHYTIEQAKVITPYDAYKKYMYENFYFEQVKKYVEDHILF